MKLRIFSSCLVAVLMAGGSYGQEVSQLEPGLFGTGKLELVAPAGNTDKLVVRSVSHLVGKLRINTAPIDQFNITYVKKTRTSSRSKAIDYIDLISVNFDRVPGQVRLEFRAPNPAPWDEKIESGIIEADIIVPEGCALDIATTYFDVIAHGPFETVSIPKSLGKIEITGVTRGLDVATDNQRVKLDSIAGEINVATSNAELSGEHIQSKGTATFRNEGGDIRLKDYRGGINVRNQYGRVVIDQFYPAGSGNFIRCTSAPILLDIVEMPSGQLVVNNRYEDVEISIPDTLQAFFSLAVGDNGTIETTGFPFRSDQVQRNRLNLISGDGHVEISSRVRGQGNIYIRGRSEE